MIFTEGITRALNEGYEISFKAAYEIGLNVLEMRLSKDGLHCKRYLDTLVLKDKEEEFEEHLDRMIRWSMGEIEFKKENQNADN